MAGMELALDHPGDGTTYEPWVSPDQLQGVEADSVDLASVCQVATEILFMLSGRQFGVREKTIRPITDTTSNRDWNRNKRAQILGWCFTGERELVLAGPVREIVQIKLDGAVLPSTAYTLLDRRRLLRVPSVPWPTHQRLDLPDTAQGTLSIHFKWGKDVPEGGKVAAKLFAQQLGLYLAGRKCSLSDSLSTVTRQGTSRTHLDPSEFTRLSKTGLYLVDTWLNAVNPSGSRRRPRVFNPDDVRKSRVT